MRLIVIDKACDFQSRLAALLKQASTDNGGGQEMDAVLVAQVKLLNPHVDFERLEAGTVLLVPEMSGLDDSNSRALGGGMFQAFSSHLLAGMGAVACRIDQDIAARTAEQAAVEEFVHTEAAKHLDQPLEEQLTRAHAASSAEKEQGQQALRTVEAMAAALKEELAALEKVLK